MARILIIAGGERARALARELVGEGHAARMTTPDESGRSAIEALGAECWIGTPDRLGTLRYALDGVTIACWLLGDASGSEEQMRALHGSRLEFFAGQAIDTTVRGIVYEAAGTVPAEILTAGRALIAARAAHNAIPLAFIDADPAHASLWHEQARAAIEQLL